ILGDAESVDYDSATQQTMSNLQSREPPKNAESFLPSGDKTEDAKATLTQAALHSENARHQTGEAREKSLAQSEAYRESYNNLTGENLTTSDVSRVARLGADGKNNG
ncbi:hypothetical protein FPK35_22755, partial [Acinetobacter baumannii]|nr:hypothetical protein [Acinetobacter baumannii]